MYGAVQCAINLTADDIGAGHFNPGAALQASYKLIIKRNLLSVSSCGFFKVHLMNAAGSKHGP